MKSAVNGSPPMPMAPRAQPARRHARSSEQRLVRGVPAIQLMSSVDRFSRSRSAGSVTPAAVRCARYCCTECSEAAAISPKSHAPTRTNTPPGRRVVPSTIAGLQRRTRRVARWSRRETSRRAANRVSVAPAAAAASARSRPIPAASVTIANGGARRSRVSSRDRYRPAVACSNTVSRDRASRGSTSTDRSARCAPPQARATALKRPLRTANVFKGSGVPRTRPARPQPPQLAAQVRRPGVDELARVAVIDQNLADAPADRRSLDGQRAQGLRQPLEVRRERLERDRMEHLAAHGRELRAGGQPQVRLGAAALIGVPRVDGGAGLRAVGVDRREAVRERAGQEHRVRLLGLRGGRGGSRREQATRERGNPEMTSEHGDPFRMVAVPGRSGSLSVDAPGEAVQAPVRGVC